MPNRSKHIKHQTLDRLLYLISFGTCSGGFSLRLRSKVPGGKGKIKFTCIYSIPCEELIY